MERPADRSSEKRRQALTVAAILFGVLVVWGLSMWTISASLRRTAFLIAMDRASRTTLEPYVHRAKSLGLECAKAYADPAAKLKPVLWKVEESGKGGYCEGRTQLTFVWSNPEEAAKRFDRPGRSRFTVLGVVMAPATSSSPLKLQYLGSWDGE